VETIDRIPVGKVQRASKMLQTGAKVGVNYVRYYTDKVFTSEQEAKERLDEKNAHDIYNGLKKLKGSALKVAQMLSMDKSILPQAYVEKFSLSQFSVPPLSPALVQRTFKKYFGQAPSELFDSFDSTSIYAASIGQVHLARKGDQKLAVKIQYPGVAESISSDLSMVKPIAMSMFNIPSKGSEKYFQEVENKLLEETNYTLEVAQSVEISEACGHLSNMQFPKYYPEFSSDRIITMDWMDGAHLSEFARSNTNENYARLVGQTLWDFFMFQIHGLRKVHADPHPGNFLVTDKNQLVALDFGCVKSIPESFYTPYFQLIQEENLANEMKFREILTTLEVLKPTDSESDKEFFAAMFREMIELFTEPFRSEIFDFSDATYFDRIKNLAEKLARTTDIQTVDASRGSEHFIYLNRTFFGLYNLMFDIRAKDIIVMNYLHYIK
jgi:predicted unusual protein kinase regulating ubiquinone biosynthesis (AarF/ABC1/UbiB family)